MNNSQATRGSVKRAACVCVVISLMTNLARARTFSLYLSYSTIITMVTNLNAHWRVESRQSSIHTSQHGLSMQVRMDCDVIEQAKGFEC